MIKGAMIGVAGLVCGLGAGQAMAAAEGGNPDVPAAPWTGFSEDLLFRRVELPLAVLPKEALAIATEASELRPVPESLKFIMSTATDPFGNVWFGCEDSGVFLYTPANGRWRHFTTKDGLGDDSGYSIAADHLGRVWVGHLNHGVSVFVPAADPNSPLERGSWRNYEVVAGLSRPHSLAGPIGERIFKIAVCPQSRVTPASACSGDVWMATSAGLARYSVMKDENGTGPSQIAIRKSKSENGRWRYYTRAEGLPSDQAQSLAFAPDGTLYVGTQCDGIAIASPKDDYTTWRTIQAPAAFHSPLSTFHSPIPTVPCGEGLPTNLINDLLVAKDGTVYAATTTGLAWSEDAGQSWRFIRGADWTDKVRGLYGGPPKGWDESAVAAASFSTKHPECLAEDYITCLSEDAQGQLRVGYRRKGYEATGPSSTRRLLAGGNPNDYVMSLLPLPDGSTYIGMYGEGARRLASNAGNRSVLFTDIAILLR